jgi:hypothetical protein
MFTAGKATITFLLGSNGTVEITEASVASTYCSGSLGATGDGRTCN